MQELSDDFLDAEHALVCSKANRVLEGHEDSLWRCAYDLEGGACRMNGHGPYQVELYYAYQECESGIYHAFEEVNPAANMDGDKMAEKLAAMLDTSPEDERFSCKSMLIRLPASVGQMIEDNALKGYFAAQKELG